MNGCAESNLHFAASLILPGCVGVPCSALCQMTCWHDEILIWRHVRSAPNLFFNGCRSLTSPDPPKEASFRPLLTRLNVRRLALCEQSISAYKSLFPSPITGAWGCSEVRRANADIGCSAVPSKRARVGA